VLSYTFRMRKIVALAAILLSAVAAYGQSSDPLWNELMAGNARFVAGSLEYCALRPLRNATAGGQSPQTSILSCSDSRVPPELIFDRSIGELFVVRVAGNVEDTFGIASLEYAVINKWTKVIVVMGHSDCGAVKTAFEPPPLDKLTPALRELVARIQKSFKADPPHNLREAIIANVNYTAAQLAMNPTLKGMPIVKAYYDVATGKVEVIP
jgi:carbonic anhydrase